MPPTIEQLRKRQERDRRRVAGLRRSRGRSGVTADTRGLLDTLISTGGSSLDSPEARRVAAQARRESGAPDITSPAFVAEQLRAGALRDPSQADKLNIRAARFQARADALPPPQVPRSIDERTLVSELGNIETRNTAGERRLAQFQQTEDRRKRIAAEGLTPEQGIARQARRETTAAEERQNKLKIQAVRFGETERARGAIGAGTGAAEVAAEGQLAATEATIRGQLAVGEQAGSQRIAEIEAQAKADAEFVKLSSGNADVVVDAQGNESFKIGSKSDKLQKTMASTRRALNNAADEVSGKGIAIGGGGDARAALVALANLMENIPEDQRDAVKERLLRALAVKQRLFTSGVRVAKYQRMLEMITEFDTEALLEFAQEQ